jgi:hypothetical protein
MATLNSIIVPWLIAEFGIDYADWNNQKTATAMIAHVIVTEQLGGNTALWKHRARIPSNNRWISRPAGSVYQDNFATNR